MKKANQQCATDEDCNSQTIDDFSSSDDNLSVGHISFSKQNHRPKTIKDKISVSSKLTNHKRNSTFIPRKPMKFSNESIVNQNRICESMDKFLGNCKSILKTFLYIFVVCNQIALKGCLN